MLTYFKNIFSSPNDIKLDILIFYISKLLLFRAKPEVVYTKRVLRMISGLGGGKLKKYGNGFDFEIPYEGIDLKITIRDQATSDFGIFKELFKFNEYKMLFDHTGYYKRNDIINIVDAGGNIGLFSTLCKAHWPNASIWSIEPDKKANQIAGKIFSDNQFADVNLLNGALWHNNNFLKIVNEPDNYADNAGFRVEETADSNDIHAFTLHDIIGIIPAHFIDILKVDIEGSEKYIFSNSNFGIAYSHLIDTIILEIHEDLCDKDQIVKVVTDGGFGLVVNSSNVYLFRSKNRVF